ncbi:MAG: sarcosine oxidase subunit gamma [Caulobacteraceae bacterium]
MDDATAKLQAAGAPVTIGAIGLARLLTLRLFKPDEATIALASARLGFEIPVAAGGFTPGSPSAARMGPGEWLVRDGPAGDIAARLEGVFHHVSEIAPGRVAWRIDGPAARDLISAGCSIDLHPRVFPAGACVRTLLAQVGVLLSRPHDGEGFEIIAARPDGDYLGRWLNDAAMGLQAGR